MNMLSPEEAREILSRIRRPHPDEHLGISLPGYQFYEKNRQARIRHWEYHHQGGWVPCGDNWWLFRQTLAEYDEAAKRHVAMNARLREEGWDLYDGSEHDIDRVREETYGEDLG